MKEDIAKSTDPSSPQHEDNLFKLRSYIKKFYRDAIALEYGVDKRETINEIKHKTSMSGANAWMLMCSIVIASIGLNTNSPAVIIGAMLISPLMSPILGIGLAVGINDQDTLKKSLAHFSMAVLIALVTSLIYFSLTPLQGITEQISDRTAPGPLDIFIAFFGGIAGIVSIVRKDVSTTLPGVAIATALMPPLCVTGFGLATGNWEIALTSFFLFFINTVFVSFSTYIIVHFVLKFPQKDFLNKVEKRKNTYYILGFLLAIAIISYFPFRNILKDRSDKIKVDKFVNEVLGENKKYLDDKIFSSKDGSNLLVMKVYGDSINTDKISYYQQSLEDIGLKNTKIEIIPTTEITMKDLQNLDLKITGIKDMSSQLEIVKGQKTENEKAIISLRSELQSYKMDSTDFNQLCSEIKSLQPDISEITYARGQINGFSTYDHKRTLLVIEWNRKTKDQKERQEYLHNFLKLRMKNDSLRVMDLFVE